ncbi:MAG: hypothetical protein P1V20_09745 [Verrucomicrobiales bacterium]|nr:hypothetical protein [Verrucomicrobiales bacterium]
MSSTLACTAEHCVSALSVGDLVDLYFPNFDVISGQLLRKDEILDVALLSIDLSGVSIAPIEMIARPTTGTLDGRPWNLHGFPVRLHEEDLENSGISLAGTVRNSRASVDNGPAIQLQCDEGGRITNDGVSPFEGVSGCPVMTSLEAESDDTFAIGVTSHHPRAQDNILFCTPVDSVITDYSTDFENIEIRSWDSFKCFPTLGVAGSGYKTNLDETLLQEIWEKGMTGFWCDIQADECRYLSSALERIIVHAPFILTRPTTDLCFKGASGWKSRCYTNSKQWVPVAGKPSIKTIEKYSFVELPKTLQLVGGKQFASSEALASYFERLCDQWAFTKIREKLIEVFDDPLGHLSYEISLEIVPVMEEIWGRWREILENDPSVLHHFLGLMLSSNGAQSMQNNAAGVGPETLETCIVPSVAFTLAICSALPEVVQKPKGNGPGNLGDENLSGHSCAVQTIGGKALQTVERVHQWRTPFVFLPHLHETWEIFETGQARFDKGSQSATTISEDPKSSIVVPRDGEILRAIGTSLEALWEVLEKRRESLLVDQERYVEEAKNVDA